MTPEMHAEGGREGRGAGRVDSRQRQHARGDQRGERRVRPEHEEPRRADHGIDEERHDGRVQTVHRREPGCLGVAHACRYEQAGEHETGADVVPQPGSGVRACDAGAGHPAHQPVGPA